MDDFKRKTFNDYTSWDMDWCKRNSRNAKTRKKLSDLFKRKARRKLKAELNKQKEE